MENNNVSPKRSSYGVASMIVGLIGIFVAALPCGVISIVLYYCSVKEDAQKGFSSKSGFAIAGLIIGIIDIAIRVIQIAFTGM